MSNYTPTTNFTALTTAQAVINGAAFDVEYGNIATAIASKLDNTTGYTGPFVMNVNGTNVTLTVNGAPGVNTATFNASTTVGQSFGLLLNGGTNTSDRCILYRSASGTVFGEIFGDGGWTIGTPTSGTKGLGNLNIAGNYYINGVQVPLITTGSFTVTLTGCTTAPTTTCFYTLNGTAVTLYIPTLSATSNATTMTLTGLPAGIQPGTAKNGSPMTVTDNGNSGLLALPNIVSGTINFTLFGTGSVANRVQSGTGFTSTGTKGVLSGTITYDIT